MRILLVEDEPRAARAVANGLREQAYAVDVASDGEDALYQTAITDYDAIVLDVGLPRADGVTVCQELRRRGSRVPVLMLTARDAIDARIAGLDSGADDYLTKPFDFGELLARLRAVIRRGRNPIAPAIVRVGPLEINTAARRVSHGGRDVALTSREYALLEFLAQRPDTVVGRAELAEHVWDARSDLMSNAIDVCVQRLRRKLSQSGTVDLIGTRRGEGYVLLSRPEVA